MASERMVCFVAAERGKTGGAYKQRRRDAWDALDAIIKGLAKIIHGFVK